METEDPTFEVELATLARISQKAAELILSQKGPRKRDAV
jgi:hypothetical protein